MEVTEVFLCCLWILFIVLPRPFPLLLALKQKYSIQFLALLPLTKSLIFFNSWTHVSFALTSHTPGDESVRSIVNWIDLFTHFLVSTSDSPFRGSHQVMFVWHAAKKIYFPWRKLTLANQLDAVTYLMSSLYLLYWRDRSTACFFLMTSVAYFVLRFATFVY
eukprot:m.26362 g.26362  ORF g.26362 m.26362 type:complete len:162 (+) comp29276_c0_seq1:52-537(+)